MVEFKWACNVCKALLEDADDVLAHVVTEHRSVALYATPVAVDQFNVPLQKTAKKKVVDEEEDEEEYDKDGEEEDEENLALEAFEADEKPKKKSLREQLRR